MGSYARRTQSLAIAALVAIAVALGFALAPQGHAQAAEGGGSELAGVELGAQAAKTADEVKAEIEGLLNGHIDQGYQDPTTYSAADEAAVNAVNADFEALSADDQAKLDAETSSVGQPLGRILEVATWATLSCSEIDNSTTLPDGTYDASTTPALSSEYSKGKSTSSRQRPWSVKEVTVKDGKATATLAVESSTYPGVWVGGTTYPKTNSSGNCEFANVPIDLNSTFYFAGVSSTMPVPIAFSLTTTIKEPLVDGTYALPDLVAGPSSMFNHFVEDSGRLVVSGDTATVQFITDGSTASIQKYTKIAIGKSSELLEVSYQPEIDASVTVIEGVLQPKENDSDSDQYLFAIPLATSAVEDLLFNDDEEDIYVTIWNSQGASSNGNVPGWYKASNDIYLTLGILGDKLNDQDDSKAAADKAAADEAAEAVAAIGEVSLDSKDAIDAAQAAVAALTDEQKALLPEDAIANLEAAQAAYDKAVADKEAADQAAADQAAAEKAAADQAAADKAAAEKAAAELAAASTINTAKVTKAQIEKASDLGATTITLGKKVKKIAKGAFKGTNIKTIVVQTKKLSKKSVKGALKGSKVKTVKVKIGSKKTNKKYVKKYKKIFTKKNAGKKAKVK